VATVNEVDFLDMLRRRALTGSEQPLPERPMQAPMLSPDMLNRIDADLFAREQAGMSMRPDLREVSGMHEPMNPLANLAALGANAWSLSTTPPGQMADWQFDPDRTHADVTDDMGLDGWRGAAAQAFMSLLEPGVGQAAAVAPKVWRAASAAIKKATGVSRVTRNMPIERIPIEARVNRAAGGRFDGWRAHGVTVNARANPDSMAHGVDLLVDGKFVGWMDWNVRTGEERLLVRTPSGAEVLESADFDSLESMLSSATLRYLGFPWE
jgi:hypothetical protein